MTCIHGIVYSRNVLSEIDFESFHIYFACAWGTVRPPAGADGAMGRASSGMAHLTRHVGAFGTTLQLS